MTTDPKWVEPPRILGLVDGEPMIVYWDWYYAEGGEGFEAGQTAWVNSAEGSALRAEPTCWLPLPKPHNGSARKRAKAVR